MSEEYIVFAGNSGGQMTFHQVLGYLDYMIDQGILKNRMALEIWNKDSIDSYFYDDFNIKKVLLGMENLPKSYTVFRAEVLNHEGMEDNLEKMSERYPDLKHEFYAKDSERLTEMKRQLKPLINEICSRKDTKIPLEEELMIF